MLILLPPSEGKYQPSRGKPLDLSAISFEALSPAREQVIDALARLAERPEAANILGLGPTQASEVLRNRDLLDAPTARADQIYTGVLFDALDPATLSAAAKARLSRWVVITSSVFGWVRPSDRIPSYRLAGDVTLPGLGTVAGHWRPALTPVAEEAAADQLIVDLRSATYAAFWRPSSDLAGQLATIRVLQEVAGVRKVVSHFNKATKGRLVRQLLSEAVNPSTPAKLAAALDDLGWTVEVGPPSPHGTRIDVIVAEV